MGDYFIDIEEIPVYAWIICGLCVALIVAGIIVLASKSRRTRNKDRFLVNDGKVHKMHDLSFGFDTLHGREAEPEEEPEEEFLPVFNQVDPTVQATPVGPYTSWDYRKQSSETKQEASFAGFIQKTESLAELKPAPIRIETPGLQAILGLESQPTELEIQPTDLENQPAESETILPQAKEESAPSSDWNIDEQLLLFKSHELLLTLTEGLRKAAAAKTEASRKDKLNELMEAVSLLDAKNEWEEYKNCFEKIYPGFWKKVEQLAGEGEMTPFELRLCALLSLGMTSKDIADISNRSVRTVETAVYKIRKKLNIDSEEKTQDFLLRLRNR